MKNVNKKFSETEIRINCRFSYLHVFTPKKDENTGKLKYSCRLVVPKSDKQAVEMIQSAVEAAKVLYAEKYGKPKGKLKTTVYDGDEERPDDETVAGCLYINASAVSKPGVKIYENGMVVDVLDESEVYSGAYGAANINFAPYNNSGAMGIGCYINNLLKMEDGPRLAGGQSADAAFGDLT